MTTPFYLKLGKLSKNASTQMADSFNTLPESNYKDGSYRLRRFSAFNFSHQAVNKLPQRDFVQSSELNKFQGDIPRRYEDIEARCYETAGFAEMFATFYETAGLSSDTEVEVHQLRIRAKPGQRIEVAPEGVHQDGFHRIGMFIINFERLSGGEIRVHTQQDSKPMVEYQFNNGEFLVLNDGEFWHDSTDIIGTDKDKEGYFDLFVITGDKIAA